MYTSSTAPTRNLLPLWLPIPALAPQSWARSPAPFPWAATWVLTYIVAKPCLLSYVPTRWVQTFGGTTTRSVVTLNTIFPSKSRVNHRTFPSITSKWYTPAFRGYPSGIASKSDCRPVTDVNFIQIAMVTAVLGFGENALPSKDTLPLENIPTNPHA